MRHRVTRQLRHLTATQVEDLAAGNILAPLAPQLDAIERLIATRQPSMVSYAQWQKIDAAEIASGEAQQRPRVKFTRIADMLGAAGH